MTAANDAHLITSRSDATTSLSRGELHALLRPFARPNSAKGYASFAIDVTLYVVGIAAVVLLEGLGWKIAGGVVAGQALVNLGSLSHEAAHRSMVRSALGNKVIAVVAFTMILFNYRLWIYEHHVMHHGRTQVKLNNFLSPLTLDEYRALPRWRQALYRSYHSGSGLGIVLYFLLERWPRVHFYAGSWLPERFRPSALRYTLLVAAYGAALLALLAFGSTGSALASVLCGFVLPYMTWFTVFSMTAFLQHTNPQLRWYRDVSGMGSPPESTAVHVLIPHWMNHVTHYVLEHSVHHVSAAIPHYNLKKAQAVLADNVDQHIIRMPFTLGNMQDVLRRCRLYDYENHAWTDFNGEVTAVPIDTSKYGSRRLMDTASDLLPDDAEPRSPGVFFPPEGAPATAGAQRHDA